jgi:hypothetical protein
MGWKTFNERLALITVLIIVALWLAHRWLSLPNEVIGATILQFGLIMQHYFRKAASHTDNKPKAKSRGEVASPSQE